MLYYKKKLPNVPLSPQPIITRWGTWLEAAFFYCKHFSDIKQLITELSNENCQALLDARHLMENILPSQKLAFIQINYTCVLNVISKLKSNKLSLVESLNLINQLQTSVNSVSGTIRKNKRKIKKCIT